MSLLSLIDKQILIHDFHFPLHSNSILHLLDYLSLDEQRKMYSFHFENDRKKFLFSRGVLRLILSQFLNIKPLKIEIQHTFYGKPYVSLENLSGNVHFNLSHTVDRVCIAMTLNREIGIDIEKIKPLQEMDAIIENYFSLEEKKIFSLLLEEQQKEILFYSCWTKKEALLKAIGLGIGAGTHLLREISCYNSMNSFSYFSDDWLIEDLSFSLPYCAAVAYKGNQIPIIYSNKTWEDYFIF